MKQAALLIPLFALPLIAQSECSTGAEITVSVVDRITGDGIEGVEVIRGYNLDEIQHTNAMGLVTLSNIGPDDPITVTYTYHLISPTGAATKNVKSYTYVGLMEGDAIQVEVNDVDAPPPHQTTVTGQVFGATQAQESHYHCIRAQTDAERNTMALEFEDTGALPYSIPISETSNGMLIATEVAVSLDNHCSITPEIMGFALHDNAQEQDIDLDIPFDRNNQVTFINADAGATLAHNAIQIIHDYGRPIRFLEPTQHAHSNDPSIIHSPSNLAPFGQNAGLVFEGIVRGTNLEQGAATFLNEPADISLMMRDLPMLDLEIESFWNATGGQSMTISNHAESVLNYAYYSRKYYDLDHSQGLVQQHFINDLRGDDVETILWPMLSPNTVDVPEALYPYSLRIKGMSAYGSEDDWHAARLYGQYLKEDHQWSAQYLEHTPEFPSQTIALPEEPLHPQGPDQHLLDL